MRGGGLRRGGRTERGRSPGEVPAPPAAIFPVGYRCGFSRTSLASQAYLIAAAIIAVYIVLGILYESFHSFPLTILSTLPICRPWAHSWLLMALNYDFSLML